ncbi:MAG: Enolase [Candidatus Moranbacteria bacterium GW2011_GWE2_35_2-]|nr:MAG: Enolase [Candidatus Moranbacteria bacterium GW2011_GWE2_35_2-]KKQ22737.1 MAG: Enolase [Candidatus Moranbacteria bacterium GW2011_GWF2_37_11]KKQ28891.1 MAG: Enolase [Candidatus Moranbacteria bacterium GW2011_GWD1_37_17]KKQ31032.1 MAG: Enolase [Candidatus Moranbacteria bacterium GW2011_GWE1_37_24]KKQ48095.1 MAG: Enolase [Candidatus Moranbacteria bacterium GW2011_GWD2_37_9]HBO16770.1 phosphopyruvate hydratase [Candidatus Moranbacteria bacterium]
MIKIKKVVAREILDSRGNPTVEVELELENGIKSVAAVPSGASTGSHEALELRDGDKKRYGGKGVLKAVENVNNEIAKAAVGMEVGEQEKIDRKIIELDGTENKSRLGANAILGVSLAVCRAAAMDKKKELYEYISDTFNFSKEKKMPFPMFNILNGGQHSDSGLCVQEFKLVPDGIEKYCEQLRAGSEIFYALKKSLTEKKYSTGVGDEGGFAPRLKSNSQALEIINTAIKTAGYEPGKQANIGLDVAANSFFDEKSGKYLLQPEGKTLGKEELLDLYKDWIEKYNIISIEDGLGEEDWKGWAMMNEKLGKKIMLIGDDLLVTNVKRLQTAITEKACNSVLIKVNQIGTLTETIECIKLAKANGMKTVISHRSGETTDDFIADLAVGADADYIKTGSLSRGERICKYNRLLKISEDLKI